MTQPLLSPNVQLELARARVESGGCVRLAMRGRSMLPLLHEPHVLQVTPLRSEPKVGDVIVFRSGGNHIVHRVVRAGKERAVTSGDAQPGRCEIVPYEDVLGRVDAVWADDTAQSRRVDGAAFRLRGAYFARSYPVRRAAALMLAFIRRLRAPWRRPRPFLRLYELLRDSSEGPAGSKPDALPDLVVSAAIDHRCAGFLPQNAQTSGRLRRAILGSQLNTMALSREIDQAIAVLRENGIPVTLLKGAARIYTGGERMRSHPSADIDILVPPELEESAVLAFLRNGYTQRADRATQQRFRTRHHHAAPLRRKGRRPIEIHRALAPPDVFGTPTAWNDLAPQFLEVNPGVFALDTAASALNGIMHAALTFSLRDVVFLADSLRSLSEQERAQLRRRVRADRLDPVRLGGVLAFACEFARLPCEETSLERLYRRWLLRRSDLPAVLRERSQAVDAAFLLCGGRLRQAWRIFSYRGHGMTTAGRAVTGFAALTYALLMRDAR